jgi:NAD(P)-dependent dehydrogenase (short-subunit alcohol dehydrogenase family)
MLAALDSRAPPEGTTIMTQDRATYSLKGQKVVIVGGTSGMGLGAERAALGAGADVVVASRRPEGARTVVGPETDRFEHAFVDTRAS